MNKTSFVIRAAAITGIAIGGFAFAAIAGTWTAPTAPPPNGNIAAPINVGNRAPLLNLNGIQEKTDSLVVDGGLTVLGNLVIATGTPSAGSVLTAADNTGAVTWSPASVTNAVTKIIAGNNVTISPANGIGNVTINAGRTGTVGGGCYIHGHTNASIYTVVGWGNATGHDSQTVSPDDCTCPAGYTAATIENSSVDDAAYLCLAN